MTLNRADRRLLGQPYVERIELLEEIARSVGCTCGPIDCRPIPGKPGKPKAVLLITHAESCPLDTEAFSASDFRAILDAVERT